MKQLALLMAAAALTITAACAATVPQPATASPTATASHQGDTAEALVTKRCTVCHARSVIAAASHTPEEWTLTVQTMRERGAKVSDAEAAEIASYLSAHNADDQ